MYPWRYAAILSAHHVNKCFSLACKFDPMINRSRVLTMKACQWSNYSTSGRHSVTAFVPFFATCLRQLPRHDDLYCIALINLVYSADKHFLAAKHRCAFIQWHLQASINNNLPQNCLVDSQTDCTIRSGSHCAHIPQTATSCTHLLDQRLMDNQRPVCKTQLRVCVDAVCNLSWWLAAKSYDWSLTWE